MKERLTENREFVRDPSPQSSQKALAVCDTVIEVLPADQYPDREWGPGNSPANAVAGFVANDGNFELDRLRSAKLMTTAHPDGFLARKKISA